MKMTKFFCKNFIAKLCFIIFVIFFAKATDGGIKIQEIDNFSKIRKGNYFDFTKFKNFDFDPYTKDEKLNHIQMSHKKYQWNYNGSVIYKGEFANSMASELDRITLNSKEASNLKNAKNKEMLENETKIRKKLLEKRTKKKIAKKLRNKEILDIIAIKQFTEEKNQQIVTDLVNRIYENQSNLLTQSPEQNEEFLDLLLRLQNNKNYLEKAKNESEKSALGDYKAKIVDETKGIFEDHSKEFDKLKTKHETNFICNDFKSLSHEINLLKLLTEKQLHSEKAMYLREIDHAQTLGIDSSNNILKLNNLIDNVKFKRKSTEDLIQDIRVKFANKHVKNIYRDNYNILPKNFIKTMSNTTVSMLLKLYELTNEEYFDNLKKESNNINSMLNLSKSKYYAKFRNFDFTQENLFKLIAELNKDKSQNHQENIANVEKLLPIFLEQNVNVSRDALKLPLIQLPDNVASDSIMYAIDNLDKIIYRRIQDNRLAQNNLAAGDQNFYTGLWFRLDSSKINQKSSQINLGYKADIFTATVGYDYAYQDYLFGMAYSNCNVQAKSYDKLSENSKLHIIRAYTQLYLVDNLFMQAEGFWGMGGIVKKRRVLNNASFYAKAKTEANMLGGNFLLGYDFYPHSNMYITPNASVGYKLLNIKGYKEKEDLNNIFLARSIKAKKHSKTYISCGLNMGTKLLVSNLSISPELHFNVENIINQNQDKTAISIHKKLPLINISSKKLDKLNYNFGGSIKLENSGEFNGAIHLGYNVTKSKNINAQNVYIKLNMDL